MKRLVNYFKPKEYIQLTTTLNMFSGNMNNKVLALYKFIFFFSAQKPFLKIYKFCALKKKILNRFSFIISMRQSNFINFYKYCFFYLYFFDKYYTKKLKYNILCSNFIYYLDNPDLYFRTQKLNLEIQIKTKVCTKNNRLNFKNML
jgi:hypothetical protein